MNLGEWRFKPFADIGSYLAGQLRETDRHLHLAMKDTWESDFVRTCNVLYAEKSPQWEKQWEILASGKGIYEALQKRFGIGPLNRIKVEVVREMQRRGTRDWQALNQKLVKHLSNESWMTKTTQCDDHRPPYERVIHFWTCSGLGGTSY